MNSRNKETATFLHNITYLRKRDGLSKQNMAKILGIGLASLNLIENGQLPPRLSANIIFCVHEHFGILPKDQFTKRLDD